MKVNDVIENDVTQYNDSPVPFIGRENELKPAYLCYYYNFFLLSTKEDM